MKSISKVSKQNKITALIIGLLSVGLTVFFSSIVDALTKFAYQYLDPNPDADQDIYIFIIKITLVLFIVFWFFISFSLLFNLHIKFFNFVKCFRKWCYWHQYSSVLC